MYGIGGSPGFYVFCTQICIYIDLLIRFNLKAIKIDGVGYMPLPKVACTSIKNTLFKIRENREYDPEVDAGRHIHQYWERNSENITECQFRFLVLRDPIKRFLSAYSNRVCHHTELSHEKIQGSNPAIAGSFEIYNPSLGQFIENFTKYYRVNSIFHHCKPIAEWVGNDIGQFTNIYKIEELGKLQNKLSSIFSQEVVFTRDQTGGRKIQIQDLNSNQVDFLIEFYRQDYMLLEQYYSIDGFWKEWKSGC